MAPPRRRHDRLCAKSTDLNRRLDQAGFVADGLTYDATLRNLELIGEAASRIPDEVRAAHRDIPWRLIIATRNRLIHAYLGIDDDTVWSIIRDDIPALLTALQRLGQEPRRADTDSAQ